MVKTLQFYSKAVGRLQWNLICSIGYSRLICSKYDPGLTLAYLCQGEVSALGFGMGKVKTIIFSETIAAYDLKLGCYI